MKTSIIAVIALLGSAPAFAQHGMGQNRAPGARESVRELSLEQRQLLREGWQQRRDALAQMPLEARRQLRQDVRDAGQTIYRHERQGMRQRSGQ